MNMHPRDRSRNVLPRFEPGFKLDICGARYDRLEISIELGVAATRNMAKIYEVFGDIADNSKLLRRDGDKHHPELIVRQKHTGHDGWIFCGTVKPSRGKIKAFLNLNPQRYFTHNTRHANDDAMRGCGASPYERLKVNMAQECAARRQSFGQDNFTLKSRLEEANNLDWNALLLEKITLARNFIVSEMLRLAPEGFFSLNGWAWSVNYAEIFWEFRAEEALLLAKDFGLHAAGYFKAKKKHLRYDDDNECDDGDVTYHVFYPEKKDTRIPACSFRRNRYHV